MKIDGFRLIGINLKNRTTNANMQSMKDCGNLWQEFQQQNIVGKIKGKLGDEIYAVYYDYEGDHTKPFSYFIGCSVTENAKVPKGLKSIEIPAGYYKIVKSTGQMPQCINESWQDIWKSETGRGYGFDFEVYGEKSKDPQNAEVEIFVSV